MTFKDILESSRLKCAEAAYDRALTASKMRRMAASCGHGKSARALAGIKATAANRAVVLAPEKVLIGEDIGMPTVHWKGKAGMHVPNTSTDGLVQKKVGSLLLQAVEEASKPQASDRSTQAA